MDIQFSKTFNRQYKKSDIKIKKAFEKKLELFIQNPLNPILNNHQLKGHLKDSRSINITGDWRALYSIHTKNNNIIVLFELMGTHSQLYK
ncbi:MAG: type II toxin-antitoxin system RelE/ParE family toxin [Patescibacteria group bacterium]